MPPIPAPALLITALLLWTLGASVYTAQLWRARGLTDHGVLGLALLILGAVAMAVALRGMLTLALCALAPAVFAGAILVVKVRCQIRARWRRPIPEKPVMLPSEPHPLFSRLEEGEQLGWGDFKAWDQAQAAAPAPNVGQFEHGVDPSQAEQERANRMAKLFG